MRFSFIPHRRTWKNRIVHSVIPEHLRLNFKLVDLYLIYMIDMLYLPISVYCLFSKLPAEAK